MGPQLFGLKTLPFAIEKIYFIFYGKKSAFITKKKKQQQKNKKVKTNKKRGRFQTTTPQNLYVI